MPNFFVCFSGHYLPVRVKVGFLCSSKLSCSFCRLKKKPVILNIYIMFKAKNHTFSHYVKLHVFGK